jgi:DNA-binding XRE family transcriptional regulator
MAQRKTRDAVDIIKKRFYRNKPERLADLEEARATAAVARELYALRARAGLTQAELARLVGTSRTVISRLENDDYQGHSLAMLRRIARALDMRVEVRFVPASRKRRSA